MHRDGRFYRLKRTPINISPASICAARHLVEKMGYLGVRYGVVGQRIRNPIRRITIAPLLSSSKVSYQCTLISPTSLSLSAVTNSKPVSHTSQCGHIINRMQTSVLRFGIRKKIGPFTPDQRHENRDKVQKDG